MKKLLVILFLQLLVSCGAKCKKVGENQVCDIRDGKIYETQKIGNLVWFKTDLSYKKNTGSGTNRTFCPNGNKKLCRKKGGYGWLYKWATALDVRSRYNERYFRDQKTQHQGICPNGWHIPNEEEWMDLTENRPPENFFQFSGYRREETNSFVEFGEVASYWSTLQSLDNNACVFSIRKNGSLERSCETSKSRKVNNHAVRCVKDHSFEFLSSSSSEYEYIYPSSSSEDEYIYSSSSGEYEYIYSSSSNQEYKDSDIEAREKRLNAKLDSAKTSKLGDGKKLEGHIFLLNIFIDTPNEKWTQNEKNHIIERQMWGLDWISNKASKYRVLVGFEKQAIGYLDQPMLVKDLKSSSYSWLRDGARKSLDQDLDLNGLIAWFRNAKGTENVRVIVYTKETGRSHAIVTSDPGNRRHGSSYLDDATLIYVGKKDRRYSPDDVGTLFVHEFLHLFGADDLYDNEDNGGAKGQYRQSGQRSGSLKKSIKDIVSKKGSQDIMYNSHLPFTQLEISDLTACLLGWKKHPEDWFRSAINNCRK